MYGTPRRLIATATALGDVDAWRYTSLEVHVLLNMTKNFMNNLDQFPPILSQKFLDELY